MFFGGFELSAYDKEEFQQDLRDQLEAEQSGYLLYRKQQRLYSNFFTAAIMKANNTRIGTHKPEPVRGVPSGKETTSMLYICVDDYMLKG
jgi:hypothetical protein